MFQCNTIFTAIKQNRIPDIKYWIQQGTVNDFHPWCGTPLQYAVLKNNVEAVRLILQAGGKSRGLHPILRLAIVTTDDCIDILKLLVQYGNRDFELCDPLVIVCSHNYTNKLKFLLSNFNLEQYIKKSGMNGLYYAIRNNNGDNVELLLSYGMDPNSSVWVGSATCLPLVEYAQKFYPAMYKIILESILPITKSALHF